MTLVISSLRQAAFTTLAVTFLLGCGNSSTPAPPQTPDLPQEWIAQFPGGDTVCSRGSEYAFAVHGGTVNKVVINFMGGGACWNDFTCSVADAIFNDSVNIDRLSALEGPGIYDLENPENPFRDWYHVFVPYCSGDIHWGDSVIEYEAGGQPFTMRHKGAINAGAVMEWVYENFQNPEQIFITGCSAGAYGAIGWAPYIAQNYPQSNVIQLGDSGAGIVTEEWFLDSFPSWNSLQFVPDFIPGLDPVADDWESWDLAYLYGRIGNYFPQHTFGQYNSNFDRTQTLFYQAMGGPGGAQAWSAAMRPMLQSALDQTPNFNSYIASGQTHCIINRPGFYTVETNGVRLVDWVQRQVDGRPIDRSVACEGAACDEPTVN